MVLSRASLAELLASAPLYAVIDSAFCTGTPPLAILDSLLRAGVKVVQYRHKEAFRRAHWDTCRRLAQRAHESGACLFINDRADIASLCGAGGVHLGQEDLPPEKARLFLGERFYIGRSTHNLEQAERAAREPVDYIAVGPVFATASKKNPDPVIGLELVGKVRAITEKPLVAIGGITVENARPVLDAGASAVAVIRDLLSAPDTESRAREFLAALQRRKPGPR